MGFSFKKQMKREPWALHWFKLKSWKKSTALQGPTVWQGPGLGRELISHANILLPVIRQSELHLITVPNTPQRLKKSNNENKALNKRQTNKKASNGDSYWNWSRINAFVLSSTDCLTTCFRLSLCQKTYVNLLSELFLHTTINKKHFMSAFSSKHVLVLL